MNHITYQDHRTTLLSGDAAEVLSELPEGSVDCIVTSPPYYRMRDYEVPGQLGQEATPDDYVKDLQKVFSQAHRVLADDGTLWLNLGDNYDRRGALRGMPWRVAFALQDDGWLLRNEVVWHKPNGIPESVKDRLARKHEHLFLFTKQRRYFFDLDAVREEYTGDRPASRRAHYGGNKANTAKGVWVPGSKGRNPGTVWSISTRPYPEAHFATYPYDLPLRCIKAGSRPGGAVLDPFSGAGTTGLAAHMVGRRYIGIDLKPEYHALAVDRLSSYGEAA